MAALVSLTIIVNFGLLDYLFISDYFSIFAWINWLFWAILDSFFYRKRLFRFINFRPFLCIAVINLDYYWEFWIFLINFDLKAIFLHHAYKLEILLEIMWYSNTKLFIFVLLLNTDYRLMLIKMINVSFMHLYWINLNNKTKNNITYWCQTFEQYCIKLHKEICGFR